MTNHREELLKEALGYVTKDRNSTYDAPEKNFERIAQIMAAMGYGHDVRGPMAAQDVSILMMAVKLARLGFNPTHRDSAVDMAGYAACQADVVAAGNTDTADDIARLAEYANTHQPDPAKLGAGELPGEPRFPVVRTMPVTVPDSLLTPEIDAEAKKLDDAAS